MQSPETNSKAPIQALNDQEITQYLRHFVTVQQFKKIDQGKDLIKLINSEKSAAALQKPARLVCIFLEHAKPEGKVCALQFIRELMEIGRVQIFLVIEKYLIKRLLETIEFRSHVKNILRGSSYFTQEVDKNLKNEKMVDLVRMSNTFFRMCHEVLYVWGDRYFPSSQFNSLYKKLSKYCTFPEYPSEFKFYRDAKVTQMQRSQKIALIQKHCMQRRKLPEVQKQEIKQPKLQNEVESVSEESPETQKVQTLYADDSQVKIFPTKSTKIALKPSQVNKVLPKNIIYRQSPLEDPQELKQGVISSQNHSNRLALQNRISVARQMTSVELPKHNTRQESEQYSFQEIELKVNRNSSGVKSSQKEQFFPIKAGEKFHQTVKIKQSQSPDPSKPKQIPTKYPDKQIIADEMVKNAKSSSNLPSKVSSQISQAVAHLQRSSHQAMKGAKKELAEKVAVASQSAEYQLGTEDRPNKDNQNIDFRRQANKIDQLAEQQCKIEELPKRGFSQKKSQHQKYASGKRRQNINRKLFDQDENDSFLFSKPAKRGDSSIGKKLALTCVYNIKQLCSAQKASSSHAQIKQELVPMKGSIRNLRKFRQVTLNILPTTADRNGVEEQRRFFEADALEQTMSRQLKGLQKDIKSAQKQFLSEILNNLEGAHPLSNKSGGASKLQNNFFSQARGPESCSISLVGRPKSVSNKSRASEKLNFLKRTSLSSMKAQKEAYGEGTLLFHLSRRKSVY